MFLENGRMPEGPDFFKRNFWGNFFPKILGGFGEKFFITNKVFISKLDCWIFQIKFLEILVYMSLD